VCAATGLGGISRAPEGRGAVESLERPAAAADRPDREPHDGETTAESQHVGVEGARADARGSRRPGDGVPAGEDSLLGAEVHGRAVAVEQAVDGRDLLSLARLRAPQARDAGVEIGPARALMVAVRTPVRARRV
jgi:hypothetical protein